MSRGYADFLSVRKHYVHPSGSAVLARALDDCQLLLNLIERVFAENRHTETASLIGNGLTEVWKHSGKLGEFSQKVLSSVSPRVVVDFLKANEIRTLLVYDVSVRLGFM